jgi:hypothetical protein
VLIRLARIAAARISCEQVVLAIENYALHLVLRDIGVDTDRTIQR